MIGIELALKTHHRSYDTIERHSASQVRGVLDKKSEGFRADKAVACFPPPRVGKIIGRDVLLSHQAAVAEWYRYRTVACLVTSSSPVPLKTRRVGQRCTLNLSRAETSSRWCGVVVRRGGASSGVVHVT
ncbi:uncharacterized protein TNCV_673491 [Trichonephila clavipes]|uniref:Uncharacterized protein n=1 Tax=Trichonephila clavipes TaxID=2585209 RepID=A0A8X6WDW2_TRICX|nr:uncharacterized protein TNCV_673491 [Trichonephila clavipes]